MREKTTISHITQNLPSATDWPHRNGARFQSVPPSSHVSPLTFLRWFLNRKPGPWRPPATTLPHTFPPPPDRVTGDDLRVTFIGHTTLLIQHAGLNILTDPIYGTHCSPVPVPMLRRMMPPGDPNEKLPRIDLVLLSHNHYDHLCAPTTRRLLRTFDPAWVAPRGAATTLRQLGVRRVTELDWWQSQPVGSPSGEPLTITCTPARHFSGRLPWDRDHALWGSFALTAGHGTIYFAGDSGMGPHFAAIARHFDPIRLAIIPIGAFRPREIMRPVHIDPDEAVEAHLLLNAKQSVASHFGTFRLADDGQDEPIERLRAALVAKNLDPATFRVLGFGETLAA